MVVPPSQMEDPRPRSTDILSFNEAEFPPARIRIDPNIIAAMEACEGGSKTSSKIRVKLVFINAAELNVDILTGHAGGIKFYGPAITGTGERFNFNQEPQYLARVLANLAQTPFVIDTELDLNLERIIVLLERLGVRQADALPRITPDLDLSVPALFYGEPVREQSKPVENSAIDSHCALLGVVDFGCDFAHPNFLNGHGNETRLEMLYVLDENGDQIPQRSFLKNQINDYILLPNPYVIHNPHDSANQPHQAYNPERFGAHGTLVLDAAAGNGQGTILQGVAPEAKLAFVQLRPDPDGAPPLAQSAVKGIKEIFALAGNLQPCSEFSGVPVVVNLSMNPTSGPRNGRGSLTTELANILSWNPKIAVGRAIVVAAGNVRGAGLRSAGRSISRSSGAYDAHALRVTLPDEYAPSKTKQPIVIRIYQPDDIKFHIKFADPFNPSKNFITLDPTNISRPDSWPPTPGKAYIVTNRPFFTSSGVWETTIWLKSSVFKIKRQWTFLVTPLNTGIINFYAWIDRDPLCQLAFEAIDEKNKNTIGDFGATSGIISVGTYYALMPQALPRFYSAEGPTERVVEPPSWDPLADIGEKPDIIAPGHGVHVAISNAKPIPNDRIHTDIHHQAVVASGTSLAAAHVSGLVALLLNRVEDATAEELRRVLIETAKPVEGQTPGKWIPHAGYGRVHANAALTHPFPKILSLTNVDRGIPRIIRVVVRLRNRKANITHWDVSLVTAKVYRDGTVAPVIDDIPIPWDTDLDYQGEFQLTELGDFVLQVIVKMKKGSQFQAIPMPFSAS